MAETTTKKTSGRKPRSTAAKVETVKEKTVTAETEAEVQTTVESSAAEKPEAQPKIEMYVEQKAPPVKIIYIDSVIPNNEIPIGGGRRITGSGRIFSVPMEQFEGEFMTPLTMMLIDERKFIVLSGLTDEQRHQYNCYYGEGEVVKDEGTFDMLFTMPTPQAVEIFEALCPEHQQLVATRFMSAYFEKRDNRITREKVEALNKASKAHDADGLFKPIVADFNEKNT